MHRHDSRKVAAALLNKLCRYQRELTDKQQVSDAERRHLLRIRAVAVVRTGKMERDR